MIMHDNGCFQCRTGACVRHQLRPTAPASTGPCVVTAELPSARETRLIRWNGDLGPLYLECGVSVVNQRIADIIGGGAEPSDISVFELVPVPTKMRTVVEVEE